MDGFMVLELEAETGFKNGSSGLWDFSEEQPD